MLAINIRKSMHEIFIFKYKFNPLQYETLSVIKFIDVFAKLEKVLSYKVNYLSEGFFPFNKSWQSFKY